MPIYPNAPNVFSMNVFKTISENYGGLAKSAKFAVHIKPRGFMSAWYSFAQDLTYLCEVAEMPGRSFINLDVTYYGPAQKLPVKTQYEDINLTFLCRNGTYERKFFDDWMAAINPINTFDYSYRDEYSCEVDIYQYSDVDWVFRTGSNNTTTGGRHLPIYKITLMDAYPLLVNPQPMTWQDDIFQRVMVNLTYTKWKREGIDPEPGSIPNLVIGATNTGR